MAASAVPPPSPAPPNTHHPLLDRTQPPLMWWWWWRWGRRFKAHFLVHKKRNNSLGQTPFLSVITAMLRCDNMADRGVSV